MEWGHFLQVIGSIFATAGLVMLMVFKYVIEAAVPSMVMASFGLGLGVVLLGSLVSLLQYTLQMNSATIGKSMSIPRG